MSSLRLLGGLLLGLALAGCSAPPEVQVLQPGRGDLSRSFTEQARTRLVRTFLVPMPVDGRLSTVAVREGDAVAAGQVLATVDPVPLDAQVQQEGARVRELQARLRLQQDLSVEASENSRAEARWRAEEETARALTSESVSAGYSLGQARTDRERVEKLFAQGYVPLQQVEEARLRETTEAKRVQTAGFRVRAQEAVVREAARQVRTTADLVERRKKEQEALRDQVEAARAGLARASHEAGQARLKAPVSGLVLKRFETGPGFFPAGTKLLEIGRLEDLEVVAEVLTQDALNLRPGMPVELQARDGGKLFAGTIRLVEPAGFTKPSSLGVEQQRVDVLIRLAAPPKGLGVGYRVQARFVTGARQGVLLVPRSSLMQDSDGNWYVFVVDQEKLKRRSVRTGLLGDQQVEILEGLEGQETLVAIPDSTTREGQRIRPLRSAPQPNP